MFFISYHDYAVQKALNDHLRRFEVNFVRVDHISTYSNPEPISDKIPDIFLKFSNGKERIIEIDTKPRTENDKTQVETFQRWAKSKPHVRSFIHKMAQDVI